MKTCTYIVAILFFGSVMTASANLIASESFSVDDITDDYADNQNFDASANEAVVVGTTGFSTENTWQHGTANVRPRGFAALDHGLIVGDTYEGGAVIRGTAGGLGRNSVRQLAETPTGTSFFMSGLVNLPTINHLNNNDRIAMGMIGSIDDNTWDISLGLHLGLYKDDEGDAFLSAYVDGDTHTLGNALTAFSADHMIVLGVDLNANTVDAWFALEGETTWTHALTLSGVDMVAADLGSFVLQGLGGGEETTSSGARVDEFRFGTTFESVAIPEPGVLGLFALGAGFLALIRRHKKG